MLKVLKNKPFILLIIAAVLLLGSTAGSTQAALTYYSENYMAEVTVSNIGVTLVENGNAASSGVLLSGMLADGEELVLGKAYPEAISVTNSGAIDEYVRVILTKSWKDADGNKDTTLSPDLIDLNILSGNGWIIDASASTAECTVLYYGSVLGVGASTSAVTDTLRIDPSIGTKVVETVTTDGAGLRTVTFEYEYDGYTFEIEAEVDAVQTHNAADAIKSAWGVNVSVGADGSLSLN